MNPLSPSNKGLPGLAEASEPEHRQQGYRTEFEHRKLRFLDRQRIEA
jgi:hypothetical protein